MNLKTINILKWVKTVLANTFIFIKHPVNVTWKFAKRNLMWVRIWRAPAKTKFAWVVGSQCSYNDKNEGMLVAIQSYHTKSTENHQQRFDNIRKLKSRFKIFSGDFSLFEEQRCKSILQQVYENTLQNANCYNCHLVIFINCFGMYQGKSNSSLRQNLVYRSDWLECTNRKLRW